MNLLKAMESRSKYTEISMLFIMEEGLLTSQIKLKYITQKSYGICNCSFPWMQKRGETETSYLKVKHLVF